MSSSGVATSGVRNFVLLWSRSTPAILQLILLESARLSPHPAKLQVFVLQTLNGVTQLAITCTFAFMDLTPYWFYETAVLSQVLLVGGERVGYAPSLRDRIHGHTIATITPGPSNMPPVMSALRRPVLIPNRPIELGQPLTPKFILSDRYKKTFERITLRTSCSLRMNMVGPVGVEPTTYRLRAGCSAIELQARPCNLS